ncbi:formamidopyrimidine-DNA glycosylase [Phtheirospermum japonicum]|uniref:Formamidopyrimidine-DNA glycosylase n=1 Tax=Phtheirospermum japonicum TaxID=374723 RepID=A0A830CA58_9LAMI|nr:formamidopyrimidine-DNA glycosylase [Phtheirospermum japonicum]
MPELPEVEAARRALEEHCVGKKIWKSTVADDTKVIDGVSSKDFETALVGKTIVAAHRKGKNMWLQLDSPPFPSFQFGMAGAVYIKGVAVTKYKRSAVKDTDEWPSKYSKLFVELDDGLEFSFTDKRRFAKVRLLDNPISVPPISELGPDALTEPMKVDEFHNSLSKKKIGIKALLLDQSFMSGIGNWMADEVLYQARVHPLQIASSLSKENCATLLKCINEVIENAMEVGADGSQFPSDWIFHSREKKPDKAFVDGKKIEFINAGGRTTAYVPELQKLTGNQAVKEAAKPSKRTSAGKGDNDDVSGDDDETEKPKAVKGKKTSRAKKGSAKKKSSASAEDDPDDEDDIVADVSSKKTRGATKDPPAKSKPKGRNVKNDGEGQRRRIRAKNAAAKRKHEESEDDDVSNSSGGADEDEQEEAQEVRNGKQAKAAAMSKKRAAKKKAN